MTTSLCLPPVRPNRRGKEDFSAKNLRSCTLRRSAYFQRHLGVPTRLRCESGPVEPEPDHTGGGKVHGILHPRPLRRNLEKYMKTLPLAAGLLTIATAALAETPVLTVLTYDSFTPEWGPGPAIEKGFEATCGCDVQYVMARQFWRGCSWKGQRPTPMWSSGLTPT